jgi:hypothetical protein
MFSLARDAKENEAITNTVTFDSAVATDSVRRDTQLLSDRHCSLSIVRRQPNFVYGVSAVVRFGHLDRNMELAPRCRVPREAPKRRKAARLAKTKN